MEELFSVEVYSKADLTKRVNRGTAFLTDIVRVKGAKTYATLIFLTADHVLHSVDRVLLKHCSDMLRGVYCQAELIALRRCS